MTRQGRGFVGLARLVGAYGESRADQLCCPLSCDAGGVRAAPGAVSPPSGAAGAGGAAGFPWRRPDGPLVEPCGAALSAPRLPPAPGGAGAVALGAVEAPSGRDIRFWVHLAFLGGLFAGTGLETRPFPANTTRTPRCDQKPPVLWSLVSSRVSLSEERRLRALSLWWDTLPGPLHARRALGGDLDVDVAVVGAGFTGLWTAYYLLQAAPDLRVVVLEKEVAGFGASGRNGGWCSALFPASDDRLAREHGAGAARAMRDAMQQTVDEVGHRAAGEGIQCHFAKGGTIVAARNPAQVQRAQAEVAESRSLGLGEEESALVVQERGGATDRARAVLGATFTPHCAALDPARLARGLADTVERLGASVYEGTEVHSVQPRTGSAPAVVRAEGASVRADVVVKAVEAWAPSMPGQRRALLPVYSLMIATEPLPDAFWAGAGLAHRETFSDHRHLVIYGQRTVDGRLAFGGAALPTTLARRYVHPTTGCAGFTGRSATRSWTCFLPSVTLRSPTPGVGPGRARATGLPRLVSTGAREWPGRAAMWATASPPATWLDEHWQTWSSATTATSSTCHGSLIVLRTGNQNRCGGWR